MSIENLFKKNSYNLFANSLTVNNLISNGTILNKGVFQFLEGLGPNFFLDENVMVGGIVFGQQGAISNLVIPTAADIFAFIQSVNNGNTPSVGQIFSFLINNQTAFDLTLVVTDTSVSILGNFIIPPLSNCYVTCSITNPLGVDCINVFPVISA